MLKKLLTDCNQERASTLNYYDLAFRHQGETITSSLTGTGIPLALFRYVEQEEK
jgi:hypothetical protein